MFPALQDNMKMIFSTILDWKMQADGYPAEVTSLSKKIVSGTLEVYKAAVASLLPTPLKAGEMLFLGFVSLKLVIFVC